MKPLVDALERRIALERAARSSAELQLAQITERLGAMSAEQDQTIRERTEGRSA